MKILLLTDIHEDYIAAKNAGLIEMPDLVLDCGDHAELRNIFELVPHYFIHGNHEPEKIDLDKNGFPMPYQIDSNCIYSFTNKDSAINFTGIGGNYSSRFEKQNVQEEDLFLLRKIKKGSVDILLLHESPFNFLSNFNEEQEYNPAHGLAEDIISEIKRINPFYVFSGHTGKFTQQKIGSIKAINLDDMVRGYGIIEKKEDHLLFRRGFLYPSF